MKPKLLLVYVALICLPLVVLGWLGARAMVQEREILDRRAGALLDEQLQSYDREVQLLLSVWTADWRSMDWDAGDGDSIRRMVGKDGRVTQFFSLDSEGSLTFPLNNDECTNRERDFLVRTDTVWASGAIHPNQVVNSDVPVRSKKGYFSKGKVALPQGHWYEWYWGDGLQLLYWWQVASGEIYGLEVNRVRLIADIIGTLPDSHMVTDDYALSVRMGNASGHPLYQWGNVVGDGGMQPAHSIALSAPLGAWSLDGFVRETTTSFSAVLNLGIGLAVLALVLLGLGVYFYRENSRELREAAQRVNFVNHVSHELKTPLTNIRMYAELLQDSLDPAEEEQGNRLNVILTESQRLSRLISNVLSFNRKRRSALILRPQLGSLDMVVLQVLKHFESSFEHNKITVSFEGAVPEEVAVDPDLVEQIVGNLLSNVEKYAKGGDRLRVMTLRQGEQISISVQDNGPGVPVGEDESIFEAFYRVRSDLTEGVSGTGIGLSIARDLARLHGGDLVLVPGDRGAHFVVHLVIQGEV